MFGKTNTFLHPTLSEKNLALIEIAHQRTLWKLTMALLMKKCQFPLLGNELMIYILNDAMNMILRARASLSFFECF